MGALHSYIVDVRWTGAGQAGTSSYTAYSRDHEVVIPGRPVLLASSDPAFRGNPERHNPEEMFVATISEGHMLWFLRMAARDGVVVVAYADEAVGTMRVESAGGGQFIEVVLHPRVTIRVPPPEAAGDPMTDAVLMAMHERSNEHNFIARSINFPVLLEPAPFTTAH